MISPAPRALLSRRRARALLERADFIEAYAKLYCWGNGLPFEPIEDAIARKIEARVNSGQRPDVTIAEIRAIIAAEDAKITRSQMVDSAIGHLREAACEVDVAAKLLTAAITRFNPKPRRKTRRP